MIFISLGTQKFQLNRLLEEIDELVKENKITDKVFAQVGNSSYTPSSYEYASFLTQDDFEKKINECDIFITHGGVGSITTGIKYKKKIIVYPRLAKYNEHVDDHQLQISTKYHELGLVLLAEDKDSLLECITNVDFFESKENVLVPSSEKVVNKIIEFIEG